MNVPIIAKKVARMKLRSVVSRKPSKGRNGTRAIRLDRKEVQSAATELERQVSRYMKRRPEGKPVGYPKEKIARVMMYGLVTVKGVPRNVEIVVVLQRGKGFVCGGAFGNYKSSGTPIVVIFLNGGLFPEQFLSVSGRGKYLYDEFVQILMHELTHARDIEKLESLPVQGRLPEQDEVNWDSYYNDPREVRAFAREIMDYVISNWSSLSKSMPVHQAIDYGIRFQDTWRKGAQFWTRKNQRLIYKIVETGLRDEELIP